MRGLVWRPGGCGAGWRPSGCRGRLACEYLPEAGDQVLRVDVRAQARAEADEPDLDHRPAPEVVADDRRCVRRRARRRARAPGDLDGRERLIGRIALERARAPKDLEAVLDDA